MPRSASARSRVEKKFPSKKREARECFCMRPVFSEFYAKCQSKCRKSAIEIWILKFSEPDFEFQKGFCGLYPTSQFSEPVFKKLTMVSKARFQILSKGFQSPFFENLMPTTSKSMQKIVFEAPKSQFFLTKLIIDFHQVRTKCGQRGTGSNALRSECRQRLSAAGSAASTAEQ